VATLIELCFSLAVVLVLYAIALGSQFEINVLELVLWGVAIFSFTFMAARWLTEAVVSSWMGGGGRERGPAAEGLAQLRRGRLDEAEQLLRQCLQDDPSVLEAARGLAEIAFRREQWEHYVTQVSQLLARSEALSRSDRVALCHRQADVCVDQLKDSMRAIEALARIELDYPGTADAARARQRVERILSKPLAEDTEN